MADFKRLSWMQSRLKTTPRMIYEDIDPGSGWTNDPESQYHHLLLDLPGFKQADLNLEYDDTGTIGISGGRRVSENKRVRFQKTFKAPDDSDLKNISTNFKGDTFEVDIPKLAKMKKDEPDQVINGASASSSQVQEEKREESLVPKEDKTIRDKREEIERAQDVGKNNEEKREESQIPKEEQTIQDKREEIERAQEADKNNVEEVGKNEMKEGSEIKNGDSSSNEKEEKWEEFAKSEEGREMKEEMNNEDMKSDINEEKNQPFSGSEELNMKNTPPRNDIREEKESEETAESERVLSEKRGRKRIPKQNFKQ